MFVVCRLSFVVFLFNILSAYAQDTTITTNYGNITFSSVKAYGFTVSFNSSVSNRNGILCLRATREIDSAFLAQNLGQSLPERGSSVDFAKVFQSSAPSLFNVREVVENTNYYFAMVPYRLNGSVATFVEDSSIFAHVKSKAATPGSYYSGLTFSSPDILTQLQQLLQNHTQIDYNAYKNTMVQVIFERDTVGQQKVVNCEYSGEIKIYSGSFDFVALDYSREHMLARSWMPSGGATTAPEGSDYHNLALANLGDVNSLRSNYPFGEVVQTTSSYLDCKLGKDTNQNNVFEPREEKKGDIARAIFYELVCYNGTGGSWGINYLLSYGTEQDVNVLLNWNANDPPDAFEKSKHEYIYSLQSNRNPFIDYPDLANCIDFTEILKNGVCPAVGIEEAISNESFVVFPNPASGAIFIKAENQQINRFFLNDLTGRVLLKKDIFINKSLAEIDISGVSSGFYLGVTVLASGEMISRKIEVVRQ